MVAHGYHYKKFIFNLLFCFKFHLQMHLQLASDIPGPLKDLQMHS